MSSRMLVLARARPSRSAVSSSSSSSSSPSSSSRAPSPPRVPSVARAPSPSLPSSAAKEKKKKRSGGGGGGGGSEHGGGDSTTTAAAASSSAAAAASSSSAGSSHPPHHHHHQKQPPQQPQQQRPRPLEACRALVLDAAHRPLDVLPWTRAVSLYLSRDKRVEVLSFYEEARVRSAHAEHLVPAVLRARVIVNSGNGGGGGGGKKGNGNAAARRNGSNKGRGFSSSSSSSSSPANPSATITSASLRAPAPSRRNVIARDNATCQYCGVTGPGRLTIDHIIPLSKGGRSDWSNLVTACSRCNSSKGSQTLEQLGWKLARPPRAPQRHELAMSGEGAPAEWKLWLPSPGGNKLEKA